MSVTLEVVQSFDTHRIGDTIVVGQSVAQVLIKAYPGRFQYGVATPGTEDAQSGAEGTPNAGSLPSVAATSLPAGIPVAMSRASGQLVAARADQKSLAFVAGVLSADVTAGFTATPQQGTVTLADWTAATGAPTLAVGQTYFLAAAGGLTATPDPATMTCVVRVGLATSATTLMVHPTDPIQL